MKTIALIPARGGSKGVPSKNIRLMAGKPLLSYAITCALSVATIERTIVTTEDEEIAGIARQFGAETPFLRPREFADDSAPDYPYVRHCLDYLSAEENYHPDAVVILRPTMPTRTAAEIDRAIQILSENEDVDCVRTTRPAPYPPHWMNIIKKDGCLEALIDDRYRTIRRQDLPPVVICDGYVEISRVRTIEKYKAINAGRMFALHREDSPFVDINTPDDWDYCEYLMNKSSN